MKKVADCGVPSAFSRLFCDCSAGVSGVAVKNKEGASRRVIFLTRILHFTS